MGVLLKKPMPVLSEGSNLTLVTPVLSFTVNTTLNAGQNITVTFKHNVEVDI
jgi:hypothetical protein